MLRSVLGLRPDRGADEQRAPAPTVEGVRSEHLLDPALVPVASERDARRTAAVLLPYLREHGGSVVVVHVVTRWPGGPDPTSPDQRASAAERMFAVATGEFEAAGIDVETRLLEGRNVAATILSAAADLDVASIAFVRRGGSRLVKLLAGDVERDLLAGSDCPVLAFDPAGRGEAPSAGP